MPRDAYISPYTLGGLNGYCIGQDVVSRIGLGRPFRGEIVFYSSLFQAGIDRIVGVQEELRGIKTEGVPEKRLHLVPCAESAAMRDSLKKYFDHYLKGADWTREREYSSVLALWAFLGDLLTSHRLRRPLLRTIPLPDLAPLGVTLPLEIFAPVQKLLQSGQRYESVVAVPAQEISKDRVEVIDEIMTSPTYIAVAEVHEELASNPSTVQSCLKHLEKASQALYWRWKDFLRLRSSIIRVVRHLPDLVEAVSDKKYGGATKSIAEILAAVVGKEHGLLVYDASPLLEESFVNLLLQVVKAPKPDEEEVNRRIAEYDRDKGIRLTEEKKLDSPQEQ